MEDTKILLETLDLDVLTISKSWLHALILDACIRAEGYATARLDRQTDQVSNSKLIGEDIIT